MKFFVLFLIAFLQISFLPKNHAQQLEYETIKVAHLKIGNELQWKTLEEGNNEYFIVEKSMNGFDFKEVFTCERGENTYQNKYAYLDIDIADSISYYRIKQIDTDGVYSYSKIMKIVQVFQNNLLIDYVSDLQDKEELTINFSTAKNGLLEYVLQNEKHTIIAGELLVEKGQNTLKINCEGLPLDVYLIKLQLDTEIEEILIDKSSKNTKLQVVATISKNTRNK